MHFVFLNLPIECYSPTCGGAISTIIMEVSRTLIEAGHAVSVLTVAPADGGREYDVGDVIGVRMKSRNDYSFVQRRLVALYRKMHRWDWPYYGSYVRSFQSSLRKMKSRPDAVVVFNDLVAAKYIREAAPKSRAICWLQNECRTHPKNVAKAVETTERFITCSQYIRKWTAQHHGINENRIEVIPSGVDEEKFFPRGDYLCSRRPLRVLFLGRIDPNKGADLALDAVQEVRSEGHDVTITVAGATWFYSRGDDAKDTYFMMLKGKIDAMGSGAAYMGHVPRDQVPALIREHDVACVLSRSNEPFGLVVLEAMASGLAVLASNRGGLPEACGDAAILGNPDDLTWISRAIRQFATNPSLLAKHKEMSIAHARTMTWRLAASRLQAVVERRGVNPTAESLHCGSGRDHRVHVINSACGSQGGGDSELSSRVAQVVTHEKNWQG